MIKQTSLVILAIGSLAQTACAMHEIREGSISPDLFEIRANPNGKIKLSPEMYEAVRQMAIAGIERLKQEQRHMNEARPTAQNSKKRTTVIVTFSQPTHTQPIANPVSRRTPHNQGAPMGRRQRQAIKDHNRAMLRLINQAIEEKKKEIDALLDSENK